MPEPGTAAPDPAVIDDRTYRVEPAAFAVALANALRLAGIPAGPDRVGWFVEALRLVPPDTRTELYWTARAVFLTAQEQIAAFDRVFAAVFDGDADWADNRGASDSSDLAVQRRSAADERRPHAPSVAASDGPAVPRPGGSGEQGEDEAQGERMPPAGRNWPPLPPYGSR